MKRAKLIKKDTLTQPPQSKTAPKPTGFAEFRQAVRLRPIVNSRAEFKALFRKQEAR